MPPFHIVGLSPIESHFSAAFCFMRDETEESNLWALQAFKSAVGDDLQLSAILTDGEDALNLQPPRG